MNTTLRYLWILLLATSVLLSGCQSNDPEPETPEASPFTLVEATLRLTWAKGDLIGFADVAQIGIEEEDIKYDASIYEVTYRTVYKGDSIDASTLVILPETDQEVPTLSFQHGTIGSDAEAPTNLKLGNSQVLLLSILTGTGVVAVFPDYIGFGASADLMHPYYIEDLTATAIVNAIYASRQIAHAQEINLSGDLYLAGYSQGGYATMATHKYYEEQGMPFYNLKASFPAAGGYDIKAFQEYFFDLETYDQPFYLAYVANAYKESYDWSEPLDLFFNEPYASKIPGLFDGSLNSTAINAQLTTNIEELVNADFISEVDDDKYKFITDAFRDNSLTDWIPQVRMYMYHGDADITVPYQNSVDVYNQLITNGASAEVVTFTTIEGGTHGSGVYPWIEHIGAELKKLEE